MTPENNDHHRQQHDLMTGYMGRMTEATEHISQSLDQNWEQHQAMKAGIDDLKAKQTFNAGKWAGVAAGIGAVVVIVGVLLKVLSVLKYALGQ